MTTTTANNKKPASAPAPVRPAAMNLDAMEREGAADPFEFILDAKQYTLMDPAEVDWQDLIAAMSSPHTFFRFVLPADDHLTFFAARIPAWKLNNLMNAYTEHYGLPSAPNPNGLPR